MFISCLLLLTSCLLSELLYQLMLLKNTFAVSDILCTPLKLGYVFCAIERVGCYLKRNAFFPAHLYQKHCDRCRKGKSHFLKSFFGIDFYIFINTEIYLCHTTASLLLLYHILLYTVKQLISQ